MIMGRKDTFDALSEFALLLGWANLRQNQRKVSGASSTPDSEATLTWYTSGSCEDTLFQINAHSSWRACVYAIRYRLCTGWLPFQVSLSSAAIKREAQR